MVFYGWLHCKGALGKWDYCTTEKPIPTPTPPSSGDSTGKRSEGSKIVGIVISVSVLSVGVGIFIGLRYRSKIQATLRLNSDDQADQELVRPSDRYNTASAASDPSHGDGFATTV